MSKLISLSINVDKIDATKLVKGKKGRYLNVTLDVKDEKDQYGNDCSVWQGQSEEERKAKKDRNFLGNGKVVWSSNGSDPALVAEEADEDLPF